MDKQQPTLAINNRAAMYGDGCFTTMLVKEGQIQLLERHIARLAEACLQLQINGIDWTKLEVELSEVHLEGQSVIKVFISAGEGGRGYQRDSQTKPQVFVTYHPYPKHYDEWKIRGVSLQIAKTQLGKHPLLAGIKHLNRLEQVLAKNELDSIESDDLLMCDIDGMIVESTASNVFWRVGKKWFTPDLQFAGISGVMRNQVMGRLTEIGQTPQIVRVKPEALQQANSMFICNSVMEVVPVASLKLDKEIKFDVGDTYKEIMHLCS